MSTWNTSNWFQSDIIRRFFAENSDLWRRCLLGECFIVLLLTFFQFVWNRPKSWKGSGNLSPEWLERRKYESCWLVWHYSFLYCRKFRPLTTRNDLWQQLKDTFNSVIKSADHDTNIKKAIKQLMMKSLGERDFSAQETAHHLHVFMLGASGIMRANGGYVMRTAFRRVSSRLLLGCV